MNKPNRYSYISVFHYDKDGISISFPDLPSCLPCAYTTEEAIKNAKEALGLHMWSIEEDNEEVPAPSPIASLQVEENEVLILIDVFMPSIRDNINNRFVKKTLSLPAWLAAMADENGVNCSKLFQKALMNYLGVEITQK